LGSFHRFHRWWRLPAYLAAIAVIATPVATSGTAQANPRDDAKKAQASVAKAGSLLEDATLRAQIAAKRYANAVAALPVARRRVADAKGRVAAAETAANTARRKSATAQAKYGVAADRFAGAQRRVEGSRKRFDEIVAANYRGSPVAALNVLLGASSPMDAIDRFGYVDRVMGHQQAVIDEHTAARRGARQAQDVAGAAKRRADAARFAAERALATAQGARAAALAAEQEVVALAADRQEALAIARSERAASLRKYAQAKKNEARVQKELRAWEAKNAKTGPKLRPGATLLMPVQGSLSSGFGMRINPIYGDRRMHNGADFAAGGSEPIYAAADGRVIRAGWSNGYGQFTCLSHGLRGKKAVSTCYAHQSRINVKSGQSVRRGQVIGNVGTTGNSTGNHLHFEVRLSGSPTNPVPWLPRCLC
jgi:murein DD-endopeptidase MepM/ murein hydrolase activator NlpD